MQTNSHAPTAIMESMDEARHEALIGLDIIHNGKSTKCSDPPGGNLNDKA